MDTSDASPSKPEEETENKLETVPEDIERSASTQHHADQPENEDVDFETAFEAAGYGRINHFILLMAGLILLNVTIESMGMGFVMIPAGCDLDLRQGEKGIISAGTFIGLVLGSLIAGYLCDVLGRKTVMMPNLVLGPIFTLASAIATNKWLFFVLRIAAGFCMSGSSGSIYTYLGEMYPSKRRDKAIAMASFFIAVGFGIQAILSWVIIPQIFTFTIFGEAYRSWRLILVFWTIPALVAAAMFSRVPDSPRFYMAKNRPQAALKAMAKMYSWNHRDKAENYPIKSLKGAPEKHQASFFEVIRSLGVTFRPPLVTCTALAYASIFALYFTGCGLYVWLPVVLNESLDQKDFHLSLCHVLKLRSKHVKKLTEEDCAEMLNPNVYPFCFLLFFTFGFMYILSGFYAHKFQKRTFFCVVICVCCLCLFLSVFVPQLIMSILLFILAITMGAAGSLIVGMTVEAMPVNVRSTVVCMLFVWARVAGVIANSVLGVMMYRGCEAYLAVTSLLPMAMALITWFCWPNPARVIETMKERGFIY